MPVKPDMVIATTKLSFATVGVLLLLGGCIPAGSICSLVSGHHHRVRAHMWAQTIWRAVTGRASVLRVAEQVSESHTYVFGRLMWSGTALRRS